MNQDQFDITIGRLDRILSEMMNYTKGKKGELDAENKQTLKHHAEDMVAAGNRMLDLLKEVEGTPQPGIEKVDPDSTIGTAIVAELRKERGPNNDVILLREPGTPGPMSYSFCCPYCGKIGAITVREYYVAKNDKKLLGCPKCKKTFELSPENSPTVPVPTILDAEQEEDIRRVLLKRRVLDFLESGQAETAVKFLSERPPREVALLLGDLNPTEKRVLEQFGLQL